MNNSQSLKAKRIETKYLANLVSTALTSCATGMTLIFSMQPAGAVFTPYDQKPAAFTTYNATNPTQTGLVWDFQLADKLKNRRARLITVMDFCFSGGFVGELTSKPNSYAASASDWDEFSLSCGNPGADFGIDFMQASKTKTLNNSFVDALTSTTLSQQLPQEAGDLGTATLNYLNGDRAIIFSNGDQLDFWKEVDNARNSLLTRPSLPWNDPDNMPGGPIAAYFGDGVNIPVSTGGSTPAPSWLEGSATKENIFNAIDAVFADPNFTNSSNLFLFIDDHGVNTDVIKSRHTGTRYDYQVNTSLWRGWTDKNPYGVCLVRHEVLDQNKGHYKNVTVPKAGWLWDISGGWMKYFSPDCSDRNTWLVSGIDHDFGYNHDGPPVKVIWENYYIRNNKLKLQDWGAPDNTLWGRGATVYGQSSQYAVDPQQWPGWHNGGDGWVYAPAEIPEPSSIFGLLAFTGLGLMGLRKKR